MKKKSGIILSALPLLTLGLCFISNSSFANGVNGNEVILVNSMGAQQKTGEIRGVVLDGKTSEPVIGAAVKVKGTTVGTTTNLDGEFILKASKGDVLIISYLGYESKEISISHLKTYTVELSEATESLDEVVVTAFGVGQKKESLVGAVTVCLLHLPDVFRVSLLYNVVVNRVPMGPVSGFAVNLPLVAQLVHLLFWMVWKSAVLN